MGLQSIFFGKKPVVPQAQVSDAALGAKSHAANGGNGNGPSSLMELAELQNQQDTLQISPSAPEVSQSQAAGAPGITPPLPTPEIFESQSASDEAKFQSVVGMFASDSLSQTIVRPLLYVMGGKVDATGKVTYQNSAAQALLPQALQNSNKQMLQIAIDELLQRGALNAEALNQPLTDKELSEFGQLGSVALPTHSPADVASVPMQAGAKTEPSSVPEGSSSNKATE
ncbi:MAG: hypothetical protein VKJ06_05575 [Vampirovibrionales bacterium]|nr:hypothetical protein [Vampirovibrionales bacterium]